jgi:two-component system sensor histidine kinase RegB
MHTALPAALDPRASTRVAWLTGVRLVGLAGAALVALLGRGEAPEPMRGALFAVLALNAAATVVLQSRRRFDRPLTIATVLVLDAALLTVTLATRGGPTNPASVLFLVVSALGALLLPVREALAVLAATIGGYALLLFGPPPFGSTSCHVDASAYAEHLRGMFSVNALTSAFLVAIVQRLRTTLERVEASLADAERRKTRHEKLASLSSLAATAAHELGTPLGTIRVVSRELERAAERLGDASLLDDARLVRAEVERCRELLGELGQRTGSAHGEAPARMSARTFAAELRLLLEERGLRAEVSSPATDFAFTAPRRALLRTIANLVKNAIDASLPESATPSVSISRAQDEVRITVEDDGAGMSTATLAQLGEPFFTTKGPEHGLGLGVFLARELAEGLEGSLHYAPRTPRGTLAVFAWPDHPTEPA